MSQMEGFFQSAPTDPRLLAVVENTAQVNQAGLTQSKTEAPACWPEKKGTKVAWRPISRDPNTHQAFQTEQDKEPSQALDQKIPLLRCQKKNKKHKQTSLLFFLDWNVYDGVSELSKQLSLVLKRPEPSPAHMASNVFFSISIRRKRLWMF